MLTSEVKGILWDLDDTLIDTLGARRESQRIFLRRMGVRAEEMGSIISAWERLFWYFSPGDHEHILAALHAEIQLGDNLDHSELVRVKGALRHDFMDALRASTGSHQVLQLCQGHSVPIGIVSNGDAEYQWAKLRLTQLDVYFDPSAVLFLDGATLGKPRAAPIQQGCVQLGLKTSEVAYVGDRASDVVAAHLAGCMSIRLKFQAPEALEPPNGFVLKLETPDQEISSLLELSSLLFDQP